MAKKKKTHTKSKVPRFDEVPVVQMPDSGVRLEQLCDEREVGMDGVSHWKDAAFEEADIYNLMGWFEFDGSHLDLTSIIPDIKIIKVHPRSKYEPLQHLFKTIKIEEVYFAPGSMFHSTGAFRYEVPGDTRGVGDLNLMFNDIADIGMSARSMQF
ncbi:MAG: hypothetical protein HGA41_03755 [Syntrophaceae bacterium]|nr:hypothetical protein [Syntrophaceae bacterium]